MEILIYQRELASRLQAISFSHYELVQTNQDLKIKLQTQEGKLIFHLIEEVPDSAVETVEIILMKCLLGISLL